MPRKKLTIAQQLEVVKEAQRNYKLDPRDGMCIHLRNSLSRLYKINCNFHYVNEYIPSFSKRKIEALGKKGIVPPMNKTFCGYWWPTDDKTVRPIVYEYLIKELEKQL